MLRRRALGGSGALTNESTGRTAGAAAKQPRVPMVLRATLLVSLGCAACSSPTSPDRSAALRDIYVRAFLGALQRRDEVGARRLLRAANATRQAAPGLAAQRHQGAPLLHLAIEQHRASEPFLLELLAAYPAAAREVDKRGASALLLLLERSAPAAGVEATQTILAANPAAASVGTRRRGRPRGRDLPLHAALASGASDAAVEAVLAAHPLARAHAGLRGQLPLHVAATFGRSAAIATLLDPDATGVSAERQLRLLAAADEAGYSPLHLAIIHRAPSEAALLLLGPRGSARAATLAALRGPHSDLPLHLAAEYGARPEVRRRLVDAYPAALRARDASGLTPRMLAESAGGAGDAAYYDLGGPGRNRSRTHSRGCGARPRRGRARLGGAMRHGATAPERVAGLGVREQLRLLAAPVAAERAAAADALLSRWSQLHWRPPARPCGEGPEVGRSHAATGAATHAATGAATHAAAGAATPPLETRRLLGGRGGARCVATCTPAGPAGADGGIGVGGTPLLRLLARRRATRAASAQASALSARHSRGELWVDRRTWRGDCTVLAAGNRTDDAFGACCARCGSTFGCTAWTATPQTHRQRGRGTVRCCLSLALSSEEDGAGAATRPPPGACVGRLVSAPCAAGCDPISAQPSRGTGEADAHLGSDAHEPLDAGAFPWRVSALAEVRRLQRQRGQRMSDGSVQPVATGAERGTQGARGHAAAPRVAVCAAGHTRTFVHPAVWSSISMLRGPPASPLDLYLVLGTDSESPRPQWDLGRPAPPPEPALLSRAVEALRPTAVRVLSAPSRDSCSRPATAQMGKWAVCVDMIRAREASEPHCGPQAETARGAAPRRAPAVLYDWLFRIRPDVVWLGPVDLVALAARMPSTSTVLGSNDVTALIHRSRWGALTRMRAGRLRCEPRCNGRSVAVLRKHWDGHNEYCLYASALAAEGILHIENSHPTEQVCALPHARGEPATTAAATQQRTRTATMRCRVHTPRLHTSPHRTPHIYHTSGAAAHPPR